MMKLKKLKSAITPFLNKYREWRYWNSLLNSMKKNQDKDNLKHRSMMDKKPGIALSFDDSFRVKHWYEYGKDIFGFYDIKATFNINAFHHFENQREHTQEEIDMLLELQANGHEIAHHGFKHKRAINFTNEQEIKVWLKNEIVELFEWMEKQAHSTTKEKFKRPVTYAFPHFVYDERHVKELVPNYFKIVRGHFCENNLLPNNYTGLAPSICIDAHFLKNEQILKRILKLAKKSRKNIILTCHSILPEDYIWEELSWGEESKSASNWRIAPETLHMIIDEAKRLDMPFYTTAELAGVATFIDYNFEKCIRKQLRDPITKWIFINELTKIENLDISQQNISNLAGIEYFVNLKSLNLSHNPITDFRLLDKLSKLEKVIGL